ncbi:curli-like amyloid fiber formation chaperone CsgH [Oceaniglobus trochenteri]|uniref:curli-like amyloid fiber formation chaperone CsgH n=1 Tax=Oceaniglobus trochenteri TaxID=2763260 RepID=UPI001D0002FB|nr:curli-like amyloid fiber formation chaperone CsgH [Oceaniglobus trochenteri]
MLRALLLGALVALSPAAQAQDTVLALPEIDIEPQDGMLSISGRVTGLAEGTVTARLAIAKSGAGGTVNTSQGGEIAVSAGSSDIVASTRLSAGPDVTLEVTLTLWDGEVSIGSTTVTLGQAK